MTKNLPLNPLWESLGATLKTERDWRIPSIFRDFHYEYTAVRKGVGLIDLSYRGKIEVTGKDRAAFLHNVLTNDIQSLGLGGGCYATLLSAAGKVLLDMNVLVFANFILLDLEMDLEKKALELLNKFLIQEDVKLRDVTGEYAHIALEGPRSEALAQALFAGPFPELTEHQLANFPMGETDVTIIRQNRTGEKGYHLLIPAAGAAEVADRALVVGKLYGLRPVGFGASEILRIEAGVLRYGVDMDENITLSEAGLDGIAASETKGCYPGQEVVARIKTYGGLNRKIAGLTFAKGALPGAGEKIYSGDGKEIGYVTSACVSPTLDQGIAIGILAKGFFPLGTESKRVKIKSAGGEIGAATTALPFTSLFPAAPRKST